MAGCLNHGCWIDPPKPGQIGTDGLCHCLESLGKENERALMQRINLMKRTIEAERKLKTIKEVISRFRSALEEQVQDAEQIYKELTGDGLKFNSIEAEGNLRGWITAKNPS